MNAAELRAGGIVAARLGAAMCGMADAIEAGDQERVSMEAKDVMASMAALINLNAAFGMMPDELAAELPDELRKFAEEFVAPGHVDVGSEPSLPAHAMTQCEIDDLLRSGGGGA